MRFTSSAFIFSTVALLSLITPAVNASVAVITTPAAGQHLNASGLVDVTWTITDSQRMEDINCDIALLHVDSSTSVPPSPDILQSGVSILSGNVEVQLPDVPSADIYFMQLLSEDRNTIFAQSGDFLIAG